MNYIIISLKHGTAKEPVFWRADNAGYTIHPWAAGIYSEEEVKQDQGYYNNGYSTIAVPLQSEELKEIGFECKYDDKKLKAYHRKRKGGQNA